MKPRESFEDDYVQFKYTDDKTLFLDINNFMADTKCVFTMPEKIAQCNGIIKTIADRSNVPSLDLKILPLPQLLVRLANRSDEGTILPSANIAEIELEKERFLYQGGVNCLWHEAMTDTMKCSSATVWRWCFTVLDICCQHYKISLVHGKHVPKGLNADKVVVQEWDMGGNGSNRQGKYAVRKPGEFVSQDIRYKENVLDDREVKPQDIDPEKDTLQDTGMKANMVVDRELYETETGTISDHIGKMSISDYIGKMSVMSDSSSDSEFVTLDSISVVTAKQKEKKEEQTGVVERRYGAGRGS